MPKPQYKVKNLKTGEYLEKYEGGNWVRIGHVFNAVTDYIREQKQLGYDYTYADFAIEKYKLVLSAKKRVSDMIKR